MSSKNKPIRDELERIYGKGCMFQKAYVAERLRRIMLENEKKTGKQFVAYTTYKRKYPLKRQIQMEKSMTLHHLKHKSEGGPTNLDNGAVINALAHQWLHTLPREMEERGNDMLRQYKRILDNQFAKTKPLLTEEEYLKKIEEAEGCSIELEKEEEIDLPVELDVVTIQVDEKGIKVTGKKKKKKNKVRRKHNRPRKRRYGREI